MFAELTNAPQRYAHTFHTEFHPNQSNNVESTGRNSYAPLSKVRLSLYLSGRVFFNGRTHSPGPTLKLEDQLLSIVLDYLSWAGIAQSVQRLATGWTVRGSNPGGGDILRSRPDRPWGPSSLLYNGYRVSFPGVKRRGVELTTHPHIAPGLKKE
jgi:hypothetical protein